MKRIDVVASMAVVLALCGSAVAQQGQSSPRIQMPQQGTPMPPRDTSARPATEAPVVGTATMTGKVMSAENGQPLRRATVTAIASRPPEVQRGGVFVPPRQYSARTDNEGRYTISELPAGEYTLSARRSGYAPQGYGQAVPNTPARRVSVADGAAVGPLDFSLMRSGVITGRVLDDEGEPAERVQVRLVRRQRMAGQIRTFPVGMGDTTDDQGHYRLFGVLPGEYYVMAEPGDRFAFNSPTVQGAGTDTVPTYAPGTADIGDAQKVQVLAGAETPVDIQLIASRVAAVRGQVLTSRGEPAVGSMVRLQSRAGDTMNMGRIGSVLADGKFEIGGVPPGSYMLVVQPSMMRDPTEAAAADMEGAAQPVSVDGEDITVAVRTSPGSTVRGRVILEGADVSQLGSRELRVQGQPIGEFMAAFMGPVRRGVVQPDSTFEVVGLRGTMALWLPGLPENWWVKDVRMSGQSILDGHDFGSGRAFTGVEIIVSGRATGINGTVSKPSGGNASDYAVVLFPEDETRWEQLGPNQMGPRAVRPDLSGSFKLPGLRPGSYYVLAVPAEQADMQLLQEPEQLRVLASKARTVDVKDGVMTPITLTLVDR